MKKILIVEDDRSAKEMLKKYVLSNRNYKVIEANSGKEALELIKKNTAQC